MAIAEGRGPIRFGTSGWRGVLGEDFTFDRLRSALHGVARWLTQGATAPEVVIAHDTRFLGERMAATAATIFSDYGAIPCVARGATPTPAAVRAVVRRGAAAAVVFTASHNPPEYQGMKVFDRSGRTIDDVEARKIERLARDAPSEAFDLVAPRGVDLVRPYVRELMGQLDLAALSRSRLCVVVDGMHGAGVLDGVLERAGLRVRRLRCDPDPRFGGAAPDPSAASLGALSREVASLRGQRIGLATDGDADRFAAVDADGRVLDETQSLALLVDHLARTGRIRRGVAISIATGSLVEGVAAHYGLAVVRVPIGFKHLSVALEKGVADVAGEESGGFALAGFGLDKDGMLAGCLLAELVASSGRSLGDRLAELTARHGRSVCGRIAIPATEARVADLARLTASPPLRVSDCAVRRVSRVDGLHLAFDDGFLMLRASGTEPVVRFYAEAPGPRLLARRLRAGQGLLQST